MKNITFTPKKRDNLRKAYNKAIADKEEVFTFEGKELLTKYAKYLLEYLDNLFKA